MNNVERAALKQDLVEDVDKMGWSQRTGAVKGATNGERRSFTAKPLWKVELEGKGRLKLDDVQAGDHPKVARVARGDSVATFEGASTDEQIVERDGDAFLG